MGGLKWDTVNQIHGKSKPGLSRVYCTWIIGKIYEKVIYARLYDFATCQGLMFQNQFGFRKSHSTSHAINYSAAIIEKCRKSGNHMLGIFIDLSKAFDTIDHTILISSPTTY